MNRDPWIMRGLFLLIVCMLGGGYYAIVSWQKQVESLAASIQSLKSESDDLQDQLSKVQKKLDDIIMNVEGS